MRTLSVRCAHAERAFCTQDGVTGSRDGVTGPNMDRILGAGHANLGVIHTILGAGHAILGARPNIGVSRPRTGNDCASDDSYIACKAAKTSNLNCLEPFALIKDWPASANRLLAVVLHESMYLSVVRLLGK